MLSRTRKRSRAGAALASRTSELGSGTPWAEADRGRELEQMREQETQSEFRESVSENYEGYTCRERCDYVAHAFCATRSEVWDKRVPRGSLECASSELIDDHIEIEGIAIHHFSHNHKLTRLHGDAAQVKMGGQVCQSCILPIDMGSFLYCKQCGFSLHDTCGRLPRRIEHMLHRHPLILEGMRRKIKEGVFTCSVCNQDSCGFMYRCYIDDCEFYMDVKCASFVEAFNHTAHQHPLFLEQRFDIGSSNPYKCMACGLSSTIIAVCSDPHCHFSLDLKCATLPGQLLKCSYDSHPLTLSLARIDDVHNGTPTSSLWCEMCGEKIKKTNLLIYMCNACCTTVHVECILGRHRYIKTGHKIEINGAEVDIVSNKGSADSWYCHECQRLCQGELVFIRRYNGRCFCSTKCLRSFFDTRLLPPNEALARFKRTYEHYFRIGNRI
uniref:Zinc finger PHD-type domain-containing protein n=1 Tax=Brassica oleracea var. oleracea TaxID=109376 RepID=A0A0D3A478_BRAOL